MKTSCVLLGIISGCLTITSAQADDTIVGMNFVVTRPTEITQIGISDGGVPFTSDVTVGIFDSATGGLIGPDVTFGPGLSETQNGNSVFESITPFILQRGEYSVVAVGDVPSTSGGNSGLFDVNSLQNLGNTLDLPGGGRFNSGTLFDIAGYSSKSSNPGADNAPAFTPIDPPLQGVPDGGNTAMAMAGAVAGLGWLRRKLA